MKLASRMSILGTETAFETLAKARELEAQGRTIIHLEIGEPDFDTPEHIRVVSIAELSISTIRTINTLPHNSARSTLLSPSHNPRGMAMTAPATSVRNAASCLSAARKPL